MFVFSTTILKVDILFWYMLCNKHTPTQVFGETFLHVF